MAITLNSNDKHIVKISIDERKNRIDFLRNMLFNYIQDPKTTVLRPRYYREIAQMMPKTVLEGKVDTMAKSLGSWGPHTREINKPDPVRELQYALSPATTNMMWESGLISMPYILGYGFSKSDGQILVAGFKGWSDGNDKADMFGKFTGIMAEYADLNNITGIVNKLSHNLQYTSSVSQETMGNLTTILNSVADEVGIRQLPLKQTYTENDVSEVLAVVESLPQTYVITQRRWVLLDDISELETEFTGIPTKSESSMFDDRDTFTTLMSAWYVPDRAKARASFEQYNIFVPEAGTQLV
ncbi:MAG TPA: hypothetical protein VGM95_00020 [Lactobacillaceae bacterium]|jgi:hypothetical protein